MKNSSVQAGYEYRGYDHSENTVYIFQGKGEFPTVSDWQKMPPQSVQAVSINGLPAEYVVGAFVVQSGAVEATWEEGIQVARLRWKQGERWFEIQKGSQPGQVTFMDRAGMIDLAESITPVANGE